MLTGAGPCFECAWTGILCYEQPLCEWSAWLLVNKFLPGAELWGR